MNWPAFANPLLLAGLAAVGLPVLIHYLTRARPRRIAFPPFRFLVEACAGQQAIHRLRTIVLLAIRCLAVLALVLLFARPFLKPAGDAARTEAGRRAVLILDASLSMRAVQDGLQLFARAQGEAADVLRTLESGSEAAVILAGATPQPLLPALSRNIPALHEELVRARAGFECGDPAAAIALAQKLLGGAGTIYVFSDFQQSNWEAARELPGGIVCRLRSVARGPVDNVAITSVRLDPAQPVIGEPAEVVCTVFNCTPRPRQESVRLDLGGRTRDVSVAVPPFGSANAVFETSFPEPGPFAGTVSLQPDDLREDDTRYMAGQVGKALKVLLVSDAQPSDIHSAAFYVERALAPSPEAIAGLSVERRHSQDADRGVLETADVFVLVAPTLLSGEAAEVIERRVRDGAGLMVFLDGPTAPMLMAPGFDAPFALLQPAASESGDGVVPGPKRLFAESEPGDFAATRFHRHFLTQLRDGRENDVVLAYPDGSVALALSGLGGGAAVFANLPLTPDAGDFIGNPMFPAVVHELLRALRAGVEEKAVAPGSAWILDVPAEGDGEPVVLDPAKQPVAAQVIASGRTTRLAMPAARMPGPYTVQQGDVVIAAAAVNVDPRESDTRPIALENLKAGERSAVSVVRDEEELLLSGKTRPLWPQLAAAVAALLALEMLLLAFWRKPSVRPVSFAPGLRAADPLDRGAPVTGDLDRTEEEALR